MNPLRPFLACLALALFAGTIHAAPEPRALAIGAALPARDVTMKNVDARWMSIADAAGPKGTLVLFICNHCPWVKLWQKRIAAIGNEAREQGLGVIAVNSNDPQVFPEDEFLVMWARARDVHYRFPYVLDGTSDVARAFGATITPEAFLFDAQGKLVYHGAVDDNARDEAAVKHAWLKNAVDALLAGQKIPVKKTKAIGCGLRLRAKKSS